MEGIFLRSLWKGHGLCRPPRGRLLTVRGHTRLEDFKPKRLQSYHTRSHRPAGMTIVASGALQHAEITALAEKHFGELETPKKSVSTTSPPAHKFLALRNRPQFSKVRFQLGFPTCPAADDLRHAARAAQLRNRRRTWLQAQARGQRRRTCRLSTSNQSSRCTPTPAASGSAPERPASKSVEALEKTVAELRNLTRTPLDEEAMGAGARPPKRRS